MTSGTLAYSFGLGKAVVSTPYWHARELLADERGVLVPFGDSQAIGTAITGLLTDDARRQSMRRRAYLTGRSMTWQRTAERYLATFEKVRHEQRLRVVASRPDSAIVHDSATPPQMQLGHFLAMCDETGLFSMRSTPYRIAPTAIAWTTTRARCSWPAPSIPPASSACPTH